MKFRNGSEEIDVNIIRDLGNNVYEITYEEACRVLKQNKFNDDKFGQIMASYEGADDEDPYWLFIEDVNDEDEFEMFNDYEYFFLVPDTQRGTEKVNESSYNKEEMSRSEKIELLNNTSDFSMETLQKMSDKEIDEMWDSMETSDWLKELEDEEDHNSYLESKRIVMSFEKFNESLDIEKNEVINENSSEYPLTITLELPIHEKTVDSVNDKLKSLNINNVSAKEVLENFFMYQSGYYFDETYGSILDKWIEDNKDDIENY